MKFTDLPAAARSAWCDAWRCFLRSEIRYAERFGSIITPAADVDELRKALESDSPHEPIITDELRWSSDGNWVAGHLPTHVLRGPDLLFLWNGAEWWSNENPNIFPQMTESMEEEAWTLLERESPMMESPMMDKEPTNYKFEIRRADDTGVFEGEPIRVWHLQCTDDTMIDLALLLTAAAPETFEVGVWEKNGLVFHHSGQSQGDGDTVIRRFTGGAGWWSSEALRVARERTAR